MFLIDKCKISNFQIFSKKLVKIYWVGNFFTQLKHLLFLTANTDVESARTYIYNVLHYPNNFRGKVLYDGYFIDEDLRREAAEEQSKQKTGFPTISDDRSFDEENDESGFYEKLPENEELNLFGTDDNESYYFNESNTIFNRYELASNIIDQEFVAERYEYV